MRLVWTPEAIEDRRLIYDYIEQDNPRAAMAMDELFERAAARLTAFPHMARPGVIPGTRELIAHRNYRVVHEVVGDTIRVLAVVHAARRWPPFAD